MAIFRAVENRRFLLRAATTGVSGIIDPYGRVLAESRLMTRTFLTGTDHSLPEDDVLHEARRRPRLVELDFQHHLLYYESLQTDTGERTPWPQPNDLLI